MAGPTYAHPDFLPSAGALSVQQTPPPGAQFTVPLNGVSLVEMCEGMRFFALDRCESYLHAAQDFAKRYDWDGRLVVDGHSPLQPGWQQVPISARRPSVRYDVARIIVERFTALLFGTDRFPGVSIVDDPAAEEFVKWLIDESRIQQRFIQARSLGGAVGTVCASFAYVNGAPRVQVHNAKHCRVLEWADRGDFRARSMLKAYKYPKQVYDPKARKLVIVDYFYARYWDEQREIEWEPIPMDLAKTAEWVTRVPSRVTEHGFGFCPAYWIQNRPCDEDEDGYSDFHGLFENFDEINRLLSSAARAVKANADPTLVVKTSPAHNEGHVKKGQGAAIFAEAGADYLTIPADAVDALMKTLDQIINGTLDVASVVLVDPDKVKGGQLSSLTLKMLFAPMLAQADVYREQYGEMGLKRILRDMLRAARLLGTRPSETIMGDDGGVLAVRRVAITPPDKVEVDADGKVTRTKREPGTSEMLALNWNPYFSPTWSDIQAATTAAQTANGGKPLISQRTSIASVQSLYGVTDVERELDAIHEDAEHAVQLAQKAMGPGPNPAALDDDEELDGKSGRENPEDDEEDGDTSDDEGDDGES